jgi:hypothetical protein
VGVAAELERDLTGGLAEEGRLMREEDARQLAVERRYGAT